MVEQVNIRIDYVLELLKVVLTNIMAVKIRYLRKKIYFAYDRSYSWNFCCKYLMAYMPTEIIINRNLEGFNHLLEWSDPGCSQQLNY